VNNINFQHLDPPAHNLGRSTR